MGLAQSKCAAGRGTTTSPIIGEIGSLTMHIAGYSQTKGIGVGNSINSSKFVVGGHSWYISYFPEGGQQDTADWVAVFLSLDTQGAHPHDDVVVTAAFQFSLLDGDCCQIFGRSAPAGNTFSSVNGYSESWGFSKFIRRSKLGSPWWCYRRLGGQDFHIRCDVTVLSTDRPPAGRTSASAPPQPAVVPASDLHRHLGDILATGDGADVCFMVAGEPFLAHRSVLAARSSVLKEVLFDQDTPGTCIEVNNMDAGVFGATLQFIYTDTLPHIEDGNRAPMAEGLLVAAETFNLERLKLMSEDMLREGINEETVASTLMLAENYGCQGLKKACIMFIKSTPSHLLERGHAE